MGFLELIPADELGAVYTGTQLILSAQGQAQDFTSGITFCRQPWAGGLKFDLEGWVGPLKDSHSKYKHEQKFDIHLPNPVYPEAYVIIVDLNHPKGVKVPIRWLSKKRSPPVEKSVFQETIQPEPQVELPEDAHLTEVVNRPFMIKEKVDASNYSTIDIQFEKKFLNLEGAGVQAGSIFWEFKPIKTGDTQILVTFYGGITPIVLRQSYNVTILPGESVHDG